MSSIHARPAEKKEIHPVPYKAFSRVSRQLSVVDWFMVGGRDIIVSAWQDLTITNNINNEKITIYITYLHGV